MIRIRPSTTSDVPLLLDVWRRAVQATHHFLSSEDFEQIEAIVAHQYLPNAEFWVAVDDTDRPVGFMGLSSTHIDALFVDPDRHGMGIGTMLVKHVMHDAREVTVDVNEQNERGVRFYQRLGFYTAGRSDVDAGGRPYPILHLSMTVPEDAAARNI